MLKIGLSLGTTVILVDQLTKWLIRNSLLESERYVEVSNFFNIVEVWNRGVSFGLLANDSNWTPHLLSALALFITIFLIGWLKKTKTILLAIALGLIIGGAVGNVIDRIIWGAVFDFLDFHISHYHWPAFNIADTAISIGVVLTLLDGFIAKHRKDS